MDTRTRSRTKGALAAGAAVLLLLGGTGSLASWNDEELITGSSITSGELKLGAQVCGDGWLLRKVVAGVETFVPFTNQLIVPSDVIKKVCTIDLIATGENVAADLGISTAAFGTPNALASQLSPAATFKVNNNTQTRVTEVNDTGVGGTPEIQATITVTFNGGVGGLINNSSQALTTALQNVGVTATYVHDPS